jgi:hypothetical protein
VTNAAAGVRPVLPAGYGSGFEIGERGGGPPCHARACNAACELSGYCKLC